uniref:Minor capsid protein n=1 Tax=Norovirus dog/GVI.1/Bari/91/2007/ITA TaxID=682809 RepID=C9WSX1_NORV|nr:minor capsid protein [Norovirus dog/GVI.1/Bari/91/2007/ITA]
MAGQFFANLGADLLSNGLGSLVSAGANAINQKIEFDYNQQLQSNSFQHDKEMLEAQVQATKRLQAEMIAIKGAALRAGGFTDADAARGAVGAPMTKIVDWNGTRYWAPGAMKTSAYSGQFSTQLSTARQRLNYTRSAAPGGAAGDGSQPATAVPHGSSRTAAAGETWSMSSGSYGQPRASRTTESTSFSASSTSSAGTMSRASQRTQEWVREQRARAPFLEGTLRTAFVTPPSSTTTGSLSSDGVSTVRGSLLDSWTPAFNTHRQPAFAFIRRRGESNA